MCSWESIRAWYFSPKVVTGKVDCQSQQCCGFVSSAVWHCGFVSIAVGHCGYISFSVRHFGFVSFAVQKCGFVSSAVWHWGLFSFVVQCSCGFVSSAVASVVQSWTLQLQSFLPLLHYSNRYVVCWTNPTVKETWHAPCWYPCGCIICLATCQASICMFLLVLPPLPLLFYSFLSPLPFSTLL
jgi:hypothetical protein